MLHQTGKRSCCFVSSVHASSSSLVMRLLGLTCLLGLLRRFALRFVSGLFLFTLVSTLCHSLFSAAVSLMLKYLLTILINLHCFTLVSPQLIIVFPAMSDEEEIIPRRRAVGPSNVGVPETRRAARVVMETEQFWCMVVEHEDWLPDSNLGVPPRMANSNLPKCQMCGLGKMSWALSRDEGNLIYIYIHTNDNTQCYTMFVLSPPY